MKNKIIKIHKLLKIYQDSWYKYLIRININEIKYIWLKTFIYLLEKLNTNKFNIEINELSVENINIINNLRKIWFNIEVFLDIWKEIKNLNYYIDEKTRIIDNFIFNIKYSRYNLILLENNIKYFKKESKIYLWLDNFWTQNKESVNYFIKTLNLFKKNNIYVDKNFIRNESAYKNLYIIWPKEINIDINELCNANCIFCYTNWPWYLEKRQNNFNKHKQKTDINSLINIIKQCEYLWTDYMLFWSSWEPFLIKNYVDKVLDEINKSSIKIWFFTNWYWLLKNIKKIIESENIEHFCINISSWNYDSFKNTRIWDKFYNFINTWKAIKIIREKRPDIKIKMLYVVTPLNIDWINSFVKLCNLHNVYELEIRETILYWINEKLIFTERDTKKLINELYKIDDIKIKNNIKNIIETISKKENTDNNINKAPKRCYNHHLYWLIIRQNLFWCCRSWYKIWKVDKGNIKNTILDINTNNKLFKVSKDLKTAIWEKKYSYECNNCFQIENIKEIEKYIDLKDLIKKIW